MGKAMEKLKRLYDERETAAYMRNHQNNLRRTIDAYDSDISLVEYAAQQENRLYDESLNRQIRAAEMEALEERAQEIAMEMLNSMKISGEQIGKQIAQAIDNGFSRK